MIKSDHHIVFAGVGLDRAAHLRTDPNAISERLHHSSAHILPIYQSKPLILSVPQANRDISLGWLGPQALALKSYSDPQTLFLGEDRDGKPYFALNLHERFQLDDSPIAGLGQFEALRPIASLLTSLDANAIATANALFNWHLGHSYCPKCGGKTQSSEAGWKRECRECGAEYFPRTDPVAIMLAIHDDQCLMGRQRDWPTSVYSCLAGFVEPGESFETACKRELKEEAGVIGKNVRYLFGQP